LGTKTPETEKTEASDGGGVGKSRDRGIRGGGVATKKLGNQQVILIIHHPKSSNGNPQVRNLNNTKTSGTIRRKLLRIQRKKTAKMKEQKKQSELGIVLRGGGNQTMKKLEQRRKTSVKMVLTWGKKNLWGVSLGHLAWGAKSVTFQLGP